MAKVKDIAMQIRGVSYHPEDLHDNLDEDSVVLLRANNIKDGKLILDDVVYVSKSKVAEQQYLQTGDILICASSGSKELVGKAAFVDSVKNPMTFGAFCKVVRPQPEYSEYLEHYFNSPVYRRKISALSAGANINNIKNEHIDNLDIQLVDEKKRREIITILNELNMLISLRKQQLFKLDELVKARFVEMFGEPSSNPMGWLQTTVGAECYYIKDGPHKSLTDVGMENGYPFISVRNIVNGYIDFSTAKYISEADYKDAIKKCCPEKGDILYSKGGTTGIAKLVDIDIKFANWVHLAVLKFNHNEFNGSFFEKMLNCDYCYKQSQMFTKGIANRDLVLSAMAQIKIYKPPILLQNQFAAFVERVDQQKQTVQQSLEKLELMKKALMQEYFG